MKSRNNTQINLHWTQLDFLNIKLIFLHTATACSLGYATDPELHKIVLVRLLSSQYIIYVLYNSEINSLYLSAAI